MSNYVSPIVTPLETDYITVYDMCETSFDSNGLRILTPISCTITEELNADYSLSLEHPIDDEGTWKALKEFNLIKCRGQIFRIKSKTTELKQDGSAVRTVYAKHIFYDLADKLIISCDVSGKNGQEALDAIHNSIYDDDPEGAYTEFYFTHYSDITELYINADSEAFELTSPAACILAEDNSIINRFRGELYRDNFYYSVCKRKENARDNAFVLKYGYNMLSVSETVDITDFCSYLYTKDNYDNMFAVAYVPSVNFPHNISKGKLFNYNHSNIDVLGEDMQSHFETICEPAVTYTVEFKDLSDVDLYKDFIGISELNVGDTGKIYSEELGISTTQKIISKTVDGITGETLSLVLSNQDNSFSRNDFSNTISRADNLMSRIASPYRVRQVQSQEELQQLASEGKLEKGAVYATMEGDDSS
ncbi:MAG: phage tail spike protein [Hominimerdicola sp.]